MRKSDFLRIYAFFSFKILFVGDVIENLQQHKMATEPVGKLFWKMELPMIVSMVLQALYNVIDSTFVANMKGTGALANESLTIAFPVQIMIIAISIGTGVGINTLLSKNLGEHNDEKVNAVAEKYIRGELPLCGIIRKRLPPSTLFVFTLCPLLYPPKTLS